MIECIPNAVAGIATALELGHDVTLVSADPGSYFRVSPLAKATFAHPNCEVVECERAFDIDTLVQLARDLHAKKPIHGVTTYNEYNIVHTASVAKALGLPGMSVEAALNARHKHRTRHVLAETGVRQPRFVHAPHPDDVARAVGEIGFPCVVKPSDGAASLHVVFIRNEHDLHEYVAELATLTDYGLGVIRIPDVLVEEYVPGEVISVEACVLGSGEIVNFGLTDRQLSEFPHFIEMGMTYFAGHPLQDELFELNTKVLRDLGIDFGFIHTEYLLGAAGPVLCEVNGRLAGALVPILMKIASCVDPYLEVIRLALGERPELPFAGDVTAGGHLFGSPVAGTLAKIDFSALEGRPGFHEARAYRQDGTAVPKLSKSNHDWLGHVIFTGTSRDQVNKRCENALDGIDLQLRVSVAR